MPPAADASGRGARVLAVIVAHEGARWLPRLLAALGESTRPPDEIVAVDTGSTDTSGSLLRAALGPARVVDAPSVTGFGDAVRMGLDAAARLRPAGRRRTIPDQDAEQWVWLLHDDCAPDPHALSELLAEGAPADIAAVGCRMRGWPRARRLLEVGVTTAGTGRRETHVEPGEYDQGQHDDPRDVLAVSTAGMLVRRSAWDSLGGLDPALPLYRDDIDFGWRVAASGMRVRVAPRAVVFHAEASTRGARPVGCAPRRHHRADRAAALFTLLANCHLAALPFVWFRLLIGSLTRCVGYLLVKLPGVAADELIAAAGALGRGDRVVAARARRRRARAGPRASVRRLLAPWWSPYAHGVETVLDQVGGLAAGTGAAIARTRGRGGGSEEAIESGPVSDAALSLSAAGTSWLERARRHPLVCLEVVLVVLGLIASRGLIGHGYLQGGALLPAPSGSGDWWQLLTTRRHAVGGGSTALAAPWVEMLAVPATILLGKAWLVVDLIFVLAAPLAAGAAWALASRLRLRGSVRLWASAAYGLLPVVSGAVTAGRIGTVVAAVALPWAARGALGLASPRGEEHLAWRSAWATALPLTIAAAFAPLCWPIAVAVAIVGATLLATSGRAGRAPAVLASVVAPVVALAPWSFHLLRHPGLIRYEAGLAVSGSHELTRLPWLPVFTRMGAAGAAPWWISAGLTLAAVLALLRGDTRGRVAAAWTVIALALTSAALVWRVPVPLPEGRGTGLAWVGLPVLMAGGAAVFAAAIAADGVLAAVGRRAFGWHQPLALVAVVAALTAPVLAIGWWVVTAPQGVLTRSAAVPLPAYMAEGMRTGGERVLVVTTSSGSVVHYRVLAGDGDRLGDDSVLPTAAGSTVPPALARLLSAQTPDEAGRAVSRLARLGIGYLTVPAPQNPVVVGRLDAAPGLSPTSSNPAVRSGWQVTGVRVAATPDRSATDLWRVLVVVGDGLAWLVLAVLASPGARRRLGSGSDGDDSVGEVPS